MKQALDLDKRIKMLYISTNQDERIGFKNTKVGVHIVKVKSTIHLLLDVQSFCNTLSGN